MVDGEAAETALELVAINHGVGPVGLRRLVRGKQPHVRHPSSFTLPLGIARPDQESVRPGVETGRVAELGQVAPDGEKRLLRGVLGKVDVAQDPVRHGVEPISSGQCEAGEGLFVTALCSSHKVGVHFPLTAGGPNLSPWEGSGPNPRRRLNNGVRDKDG